MKEDFLVFIPGYGDLSTRFHWTLYYFSKIFSFFLLLQVRLCARKKLNKIPESAFICEEPPQQHYLDSGVEVTNKLGTYTFESS